MPRTPYAYELQWSNYYSVNLILFLHKFKYIDLRILNRKRQFISAQQTILNKIYRNVHRKGIECNT